MCQECVLPPPTLAVARVERVDVDVAAVVVERRADLRRREAVDGLARVGEPPEQMVVATAVDPVGPRLELRGLAGPVGEAQLARTEPRARRATEVRQRATPGLQG